MKQIMDYSYFFLERPYLKYSHFHFFLANNFVKIKSIPFSFLLPFPPSSSPHLPPGKGREGQGRERKGREKSTKTQAGDTEIP